MPFRTAGLLAALVILTACTIQQTVNPVVGGKPESICVIEDPAVREGFLDEYKRSLESLGIVVQVLPEGSAIDACDITSTYTARWSWDLTIYLSYAEINVYDTGELAGSALYDATGGSGRTDKFIDAEPKIRELVSQLFADGESVVVDPGQSE